MYLQLFWLRNMHLKMPYFYPFHPVYGKNSYSICMSAAATRPDETGAQMTLETRNAYLNSMLLKANCWTDTSRNESNLF